MGLDTNAERVLSWAGLSGCTAQVGTKQGESGLQRFKALQQGMRGGEQETCSRDITQTKTRTTVHPVAITLTKHLDDYMLMSLILFGIELQQLIE